MAALYIFITVLVLGTASFFVIRKLPEKKRSLYIKIFAIIYFLVCFAKVFFADGFIWIINGGFYGDTLYEKTDILQSLLRWGMYFSCLITTTAACTKPRVFKNISVYFCLPVMIVAMFFFKNFMAYYMDGLGRGIQATYWVRAMILGAEFVLGILIPILITLNGHYFNVKSGKEWALFCGILPLLFLTTFPVYIPQSLFGYTQIVMKPLGIVNILWIVITISIILILIKVFRNKDYDTRYAVCLWLALDLFIHYNQLYLMGFSISRLPFQLCNLGAYFFILVMVFKWKRLYEFSFVANIVGTIIAMSVPDMSSHGLAYFWNIHFIFEHGLVLIVPSVIMGLNIFSRLTKKSLLYIFVGFTIYFMFCSIAGSLLNIYGYSNNYFYIFDPMKITDIVPFLSFTTKRFFTVNGYILYPIYQLMIFLLYSGLMLLFYLLVRWIYTITDDNIEIEKRGKVLTKKVFKKIFKKKKKEVKDAEN